MQPPSQGSGRIASPSPQHLKRPEVTSMHMPHHSHAHIHPISPHLRPCSLQTLTVSSGFRTPYDLANHSGTVSKSSILAGSYQANTALSSHDSTVFPCRIRFFFPDLFLPIHFLLPQLLRCSQFRLFPHCICRPLNRLPLCHIPRAERTP